EPTKPTSKKTASQPPPAIVWYYPFKFTATSAAGKKLEELVRRFSEAEKRGDYVVVDDRDPAAIAETYCDERMPLTVSELSRAMSQDASEPERRAHLDRALRTPSGVAWREVDMLLSTWPKDQHPNDALAHASSALERWPSSHRDPTLQTKEAVARG